MEGVTNQLIATTDDVLVAEAACHRQGQLIVLWLLHQMQHSLQLIARLSGLAIEALGQKHGEPGRINLQHAANHRRINALGSRGDQIVTLLGQGAGH